MNPQSLREAKTLFGQIKRVASKMRSVQTVICPPFLYIPELGKEATGHRCVIGAQDVFWEKEGAHTGEISAAQLSGAKAQYVIVGHSERRAMGVTSEMVSKKAAAAIRAGLVAVVCIGERERDEEGNYTRVLAEELRASLAGVNKPMLKNVVIAYEPIWAIGKQAKDAAHPSDVFEMSILIRKVLADMYDPQHAHRVPLLYGGSVDAQNADAFLEEGGVQGLLIGRASRNPKKFAKILDIADSLSGV